MKRFLTLFFLSLVANFSFGQPEVGLGIGLSCYNGEIGYNSNNLVLPISYTSKEKIHIFYNYAFKKYAKIRLEAGYSRFWGTDEYSNDPGLVKFKREVKGFAFDANVKLELIPKFNGNEKSPLHLLIGVGQFTTNPVNTKEGIETINRYTTNTLGLFQNFSTSAGMGLSYTFAKSKLVETLSLEYMFNYTIDDKFDGVKLGVMGDVFNTITLVYCVPLKYLPMRLRNINRNLDMRNFSECPSF